MDRVKRPRVAAIGLDQRQVESIAHLCGDLREAGSLRNYLENYCLLETDILVTARLGDELPADVVSTGIDLPATVNLFAIGVPERLYWMENLSPAGLYERSVGTAEVQTRNTERELRVSDGCLGSYKQRAEELATELTLLADPPSVITVSGSTSRDVLIETTSKKAVALRVTLPTRSNEDAPEPTSPIALLLPQSANLVAWFRAFLVDLHQTDSSRVPYPPPRLGRPEDWYTPQERQVADQIAKIESQLNRLSSERGRLKLDLSEAETKADAGIRRILWAQGDDLVDAVEEIFSDLSFKVRNLDAELNEGEPRREDLRLCLGNDPGWTAIVEVKSYSSGTRTNDSRQIREHRERFIKEEGRLPELTLWVANPYRTRDPASRPSPDQNVAESAANIGAIYVLTADLYKQWALVASGKLAAPVVVESLRNASPGLWIPPNAS